MIDEKKTFMLFKYTSVNLSHGSHKKVLMICDECGQERLVEYRRCGTLCASCIHKVKYLSTETKHKMSKNQTGKHHTEKAKLKMSKARIGTHPSKETKCKLSKNHADVSGDKNPAWKGGAQLARARSNTKRRKLFGFIPHNNQQDNFHGHHLDFENVIFIPKELHASIWHSVTKNINMDLINNAVCDWYLNYQLNDI